MTLFFLKKDPFERTLAIDVGTASITGVLSRKRRGISSVATSEKPEVLKVFRYPFDVLGKDSVRVYTDKLSKLFNEARHVEHAVDQICIGFSSPLFLEKIVRKRFVRVRPSSGITSEELRENFLEIEKTLRDVAHDTTLVARTTRYIGINGYAVVRAEGYTGKFLDVEVECMLVNSLLHAYIADAKRAFFPKSDIAYYPDSMATVAGLERITKRARPFLILDIGGEITVVCMETDHGREYAEPVPFGVRALERRIGGFLKLDASDAESVVRKLSAGTLDHVLQRKVERVVSVAMEDWWSMVKKSIAEVSVGMQPRAVAMAGGGGDIILFPRVLAAGWQQLYGNEIIPQMLTVDLLRDYFVSVGALCGGGDFVLASLLLMP